MGEFYLIPELVGRLASFLSIDEKLRVGIPPKRLTSIPSIPLTNRAEQVGYSAWQVILPIGDTKCISITMCKDIVMCIYNTTVLLHNSFGDPVLYGFMIENENSAKLASICINEG